MSLSDRIVSSLPVRRAWLSMAGALTVTAALTLSGDGRAAPPEDPADAGASDAPEPPATWRFKKHDRKVKVMLIAGSVGAWQKDPYLERFEEMCPNIEVKNLSKVGMGAYQLKQRFRDQVLENRYMPWGDDSLEFWLIFHGGLNSVAMPEKTNRYIRDIFMLAHRRGMGVVALSLTPWGDDSDRERWGGVSALWYRQYTQHIVDYVAGRSSPKEALGHQVGQRDNPEAPWDPNELADVGIDLYDSALRDPNAPSRDRAKLRAALAKDSKWKRAHADLSEAEREAALDRDSLYAAEAPKWWLRPELRSFDHIHPNHEGHALIAEIACPQLPESWGCQCPPPAAAGEAWVPAATDAAGPSPDRPTL